MKWGEGDFSVRGFLRVMRWWVPTMTILALLITSVDSRAASMTFGARLIFAVALSVLMAPIAWLSTLHIERMRVANYVMVYMAAITFVGLLIFAIVER